MLEARLALKRPDAPDDLQRAINPAEDVDATLRACEERAEERGLRRTSEENAGDAAKVLVALAERNGTDVLVIGNKVMQRKVLGSVPNSARATLPARC